MAGMRYVFVVNPTAGKKNPMKWLLPQVKNFFLERRVDFSIRQTNAPKHAVQLAREEAQKGGEVAIVAVGGDGTLCEVANGARGFSNAAVGVLPCGSGNDYLRSFGRKEDFLALPNLLEAVPYAVDMIQDGENYALNLCSVGLDASVALHMTQYKGLPLVTGHMAYNLALLRELLGPIGQPLRILVDGKFQAEGDFLFALAGSGRYYGGGYCAAPQAIVNDGLLDFVLIRRPKSKLKLPVLLKEYKSGAFLHSPRFQNLLVFLRGKRMQIEALKDKAAANWDGECAYITKASFQILPSAVRFLVPRGCVAPAILKHQEKGAAVKL